MVLGELDTVDFLGEGFGLQLNLLLLPVPDAEEIVGVGTDGGEHGAALGEVGIGIGALGSFAEDAVELEGRVLVDIYIWTVALLADGKVVFVRVDCDGADAPTIFSKIFFDLMRVDVVDDEADARDEDHVFVVDQV